MVFPIPDGDESTDWCDILATDPCWASCGTTRGSIDFPAKTTVETPRRASEKHLSNIIESQSTHWSEKYKRTDIPTEQKCQTYLPFIN
jgi:hypothetical protein